VVSVIHELSEVRIIITTKEEEEGGGKKANDSHRCFKNISLFLKLR
jgi:hypothetical protein